MNPLVSPPECSDVGDMWAQGCADRGPSGGTQRHGRRKREQQVLHKNRSKYDKDGVTVVEPSTVVPLSYCNQVPRNLRASKRRNVRVAIVQGRAAGALPNQTRHRRKSACVSSRRDVTGRTRADEAEKSKQAQEAGAIRTAPLEKRRLLCTACGVTRASLVRARAARALSEAAE